jgi:hypothetical protein
LVACHIACRDFSCVRESESFIFISLSTFGTSPQSREAEKIAGKHRTKHRFREHHLAARSSMPLRMPRHPSETRCHLKRIGESENQVARKSDKIRETKKNNRPFYYKK